MVVFLVFLFKSQRFFNFSKVGQKAYPGILKTEKNNVVFKKFFYIDKSRLQNSLKTIFKLEILC